MQKGINRFVPLVFYMTLILLLVGVTGIPDDPVAFLIMNVLILQTLGLHNESREIDELAEYIRKPYLL